MFETYSMEGFGNYMRELRRSLGMTQDQVSFLTGLSVDTLRRIERGGVVPRFDTLVILSETYKVDLIEKFKRNSVSSAFLSYYSRLDQLIVSYSEEKLKNLKQDFLRFVDNERIEPPIIYHSQKQFLLVLEGISENYKGHYEESRALCIESLQVTNPMFSVDNYRSFSYTMIEMRILLMIALSFNQPDNRLVSKDLLEFLLDCLMATPNASFHEKLLTIKVITNLSYLYHNLSEDQSAYDYAVRGIDFCLENYISFAIANLLARKGIAEYYLGHPDYMSTLQQSISLLKIERKYELAQRYIEIIKTKYDIQLEY